MLSSEGKSTDTEAKGEQVLIATQNQWEQVFHLIESVLSFEACLHHQILPFAIESNKLLLGMVNPKDSLALNYVNRILSSINCLLVSQDITAESHRKILSAYLNYKNTSVPTDKPLQLPSVNLPPQHESDLTTDNLNKTHEVERNVSSISPSLTETVAEVSTLSVNNNTSEPILDLPVLQVSNLGHFSDIELLPTLPPKKFLEQLLARVLAEGIGRLYLERQPYHGKILWSHNGALQSVLEKLPLFVFQGVLNELKRFVSLPVITVTEPKQVEKECQYQQDHLLLRLRIMPGIHGEEATLQVLRGAALKFYQQQQLARLSNDATVISQQLRHKLHELQKRFLFNSNLNSQQLKVVASVNQLLDKLDSQTKMLLETSDSSNKETKH